MALFEVLAPCRPLRYGRGRRWVTNLAIVVIDSAVMRIVFPLAAVRAALWAETRGLGLFHALGIPTFLAGIISFVVLDFAVWLEHLVSHKVPGPVPIHRMHHADPDIDLTTALRFHPLEILISMGWKAGLVVALGAPATAVLIFEAVLTMFNHSNVRLPARLDAVLRPFIVTPDMHRVHHSVIRRETDSNYGFNLSIWDRLFRTYVAEPEHGHEGMTIGLASFQNAAPTGILWSLLLPFRPQTRDGEEEPPARLNRS
ncbi:sterol desaturase family protein [Breoghania sp.]|uniref:sterol desaturase family protein n=1 Tax=Breoghania sp. TaxID=2065378 RepID=UPI002634981F|nr:sterol desaturase family protein [Breoghania sp.]MDJ0932914.1 sterol desaturase family protein [Breoghania sp.]